MFNNEFLRRSYLQYRRNSELSFVNLNFMKKCLLAFYFFLSNLFFVFQIFFKLKKTDSLGIVFLKYDDKTQPFKTINTFLSESNINFIDIEKKYLPITPFILIKDLMSEFKEKPFFVLKNLDFFFALNMKISKYYFFIKYYNVNKLVVFQEYSFYMTYLTRVMKSENLELYNVMHGIPGDTYCFFKFTKTFIWGEYFRNKYLDLKAEPNQFVLSGSIYHYAIKEKYSKLNISTSIDILYIMQGAEKGYSDVLEVLIKMSSNYNIVIKQHPRYKIKLNTVLKETEEDTLDCISKSRLVISHYSTALIDSIILDKSIISYIDLKSVEYKYISFLDDNFIVSDQKKLEIKINDMLKNEKKVFLKNDFIEFKNNPLLEILKEIGK